MIILQQNYRRGYVINGTPLLDRALFQTLSYEKKNSFFITNPMWKHVRLYNMKGHWFPWGLINDVEKIVQEYCYRYNDSYCIERDLHNSVLLDNRICTEFNLRPYQTLAVSAICNNLDGQIVMPTGSGKTLTAIAGIQNIKPKLCLIIVPNTEIKTQWKKELVKHGMINVTVHTYQYLMRHMEELVGVDMFIFDEEHHVSSTTLYKMGMQSHGRIYGFSATPTRDDGHTYKIKAVLGDIIYEVKLRDLIDRGYLSDADVYMHKSIGEKPTLFDDYNDIYDKNIVKNESRNNDIVTRAIFSSMIGLVCILIEKVEHGQILYDKFSDKDKVMFVSGKDTKKHRTEVMEDIKSGKIKIVIASKIYGEGVDIPNMQTLIIASGGKSTIKTIQNIGRVLRLFDGKKKAVIIDYFDQSRYLRSHSTSRLEIYKKYFDVKVV